MAAGRLECENGQIKGFGLFQVSIYAKAALHLTFR